MARTGLDILNRDNYFNLYVNSNVAVKRKERKTVYPKTVGTDTHREILRGTGQEWSTHADKIQIQKVRNKIRDWESISW